MRNWSNMSNCGRADKRQTSLTQACKNLFPDMTIASIPAVANWVVT
jgi:hypothetical protein